MRMELHGTPGEPAFRFVLLAETKEDREILSVFERMSLDRDHRLSFSGSTFRARLGTTEVRIGFEPRAVREAPRSVPR